MTYDVFTLLHAYLSQSVFVSHVRLFSVTSPRRHFEGIIALSSELKVYRAVL